MRFITHNVVQVGYPAPPHLRSSPIRTVAICAGSGGSMLVDKQADVYFTGEMSHVSPNLPGGSIPTPIQQAHNYSLFLFPSTRFWQQSRPGNTSFYVCLLISIKAV